MPYPARAEGLGKYGYHSKFVFQSRYYVHFREKDETHYLPQAMGQESPLLFFYKGGFGIKQPTKVDMPSNKKKNQANNVIPSQSGLRSNGNTGVLHAS